MTSSSARHRAPAARLSWVPRALLSVATVPVGALAGCALVAVSSSTAQPGLGLAGVAATGLPLALRGLRGRRAEGRPVHGRRSARSGAPVVLAAEAPVEAFAGSVAGSVAEAAAEIPAPAAARPVGTDLVLAGIPAPRRAGWEQTRTVAAPVAAPSRLFAVSAEQQVVELGADLREQEIAQLRRLWDSGTGPDTGVVATVPSLVAATAT